MAQIRENKQKYLTGYTVTTVLLRPCLPVRTIITAVIVHLRKEAAP